MLRKILIVDKADPALSENLERAGFYCETILDISYSEFINKPDQYIGLIIRSKFLLDKQALSKKSNLKFIARLGAGMESIDLEFAKSKGIHVISTPEGNAPAVAQHCLALLLSTLRHLKNADTEVRNGLWLREKNKGMEISSLSIGIIGFGNTGKAFADLLSPFHPQIMAYDKFNPGFIHQNVKEVDLTYLLENSDVISIHINYIPENFHFFNHTIFNPIKKNVILINTSRGLVLNTSDLLIALKQKKIAHACLDVLEYENVNLQIPQKEDWDDTMIQLSENPHVTLTPHIAGQTIESEKRHAQIAFEKIMGVMNL